MDSRSSTLARFKILARALQDAKNTPTSLAKACSSQGKFAEYSYSSEGIEPMALNTLKVSADKFIEDGGWQRLESMRKLYLTTYKKRKHTSNPEVTKEVKHKNQIIELQKSLDMERRYRINVQVAYESLLKKLHTMVKFDPEVANFINRHVAVFSFKRISLANEYDSNGE